MWNLALCLMGESSPFLVAFNGIVEPVGTSNAASRFSLDTLTSELKNNLVHPDFADATRYFLYLLFTLVVCGHCEVVFVKL